MTDKRDTPPPIAVLPAIGIAPSLAGADWTQQREHFKGRTVEQAREDCRRRNDVARQERAIADEQHRQRTAAIAEQARQAEEYARHQHARAGRPRPRPVAPVARPQPRPVPASPAVARRPVTTATTSASPRSGGHLDTSAVYAELAAQHFAGVGWRGAADTTGARSFGAIAQAHYRHAATREGYTILGGAR